MIAAETKAAAATVALPDISFLHCGKATRYYSDPD
jgi:hypothetical protein